MRVALVEPYYGGSHQAWADGYVANSHHLVSLFTHPARFWKWRMHGAFLTLAEQLTVDVERVGPPDVIVASSMMDVAAFAGAVRSVVPGVPIAVYFHESQFTYPLSPADHFDLSYQMKNWSSAAVGDLVIFNSRFHQEVFREEAGRFLNAFPEDKHVHRVDDVIDASVVMPVGVDIGEFMGGRRVTSGPPLIVWNQRWEHDKGPAELHEIVARLVADGIDFKMAMCGEVFVSVPAEFTEIVELLGPRLIHRGWATRERYADLLLEASVVLSTADQEFFGVGVVEAIAAGAHPVLPDRLVYPERVDALGADPATTLYSTVDEAVSLIENALGLGADDRLRAATNIYDWSAVAPQYDAALEQIADLSGV
jgi:glycosyltransferase involved in cell wall biosynthesis